MQGSVVSALATTRAAILRHVRVQAAAPARGSLPIASSWLRSLTRYFSDEAHGKGTYLDKGEVKDRVLTVVKRFEKVDKTKVSPEAHFISDLGLDSLDAVEVVMALEEEFGFEIPDAEADKILSCEDAIQYIVANPQAK